MGANQAGYVEDVAAAEVAAYMVGAILPAMLSTVQWCQSRACQLIGWCLEELTALGLTHPWWTLQACQMQAGQHRERLLMLLLCCPS
jgi:hypothetical protein